jgi:hypothetical protein
MRSSLNSGGKMIEPRRVDLFDTLETDVLSIRWYQKGGNCRELRATPDFDNIQGSMI